MHWFLYSNLKAQRDLNLNILFLVGRSVPRKQPTSSVKYRGSPVGGEGVGKPRRMRPGEKALKEIRFYQRHTGAR